MKVVELIRNKFPVSNIHTLEAYGLVFVLDVKQIIAAFYFFPGKNSRET